MLLCSDLKLCHEPKDGRWWCHSCSARTLKQRITSPMVFISVHALINQSFNYSLNFTLVRTNKVPISSGWLLPQTHSSCLFLSAATICPFRSLSSPSFRAVPGYPLWLQSIFHYYLSLHQTPPCPGCSFSDGSALDVVELSNNTSLYSWLGNWWLSTLWRKLRCMCLFR